MSYNRRYQRRSYATTTGRINRPNKRPGACRSCGEEIPAGAGQLWRDADGWSVVHTVSEWSGSPVSGQYVGGCPKETDRMNREGNFGGESGARSEYDRIRSIASLYASREPEPPRAYTSTGARMSYRCTHEDYPCCGC